MSLPISEIIRVAEIRHLITARCWTADHLHVPESSVSNDVAVAYVVRHFEAGRLSGWGGFVTDLGDRS